MIYSDIVEKANKDCKEIQTNHLIALCEIEEDYKSFCGDLEKLIQSKSNKNLVMKAYRMMSGKSFFIPKRYKNFMEKYKHTIEVVKKYSCLSNFTIFSYDAKGKRKTNLDEDYFYQYIEEHKEDIETIKAVLFKIKDLDFEKILFREKLDFSEFEYKLNTSCESKFFFLENMEVNPTHLENSIQYKTNSSCYCITLQFIDYDNRKISKYARSIELNSLVFNPNRLPNEITTRATIEFIYKLAEKKKEECKKIQQLATNFEGQIIDSYTDITDEATEKEKKLYLDRRRSSSIDND